MAATPPGSQTCSFADAEIVRVHSCPQKQPYHHRLHAVWMSGQTEASFFITQAQRLSDGTVAERVRRLFSVEIALAPVPAEAAAGTQQTQAQGSWVTLSTSNGCSDNTEKAKVKETCTCIVCANAISTAFQWRDYKPHNSLWC